MAHEQSAVDPNTARKTKTAGISNASPPQRSGVLPLIGALCAIAVGAIVWFSYHQGQRDALASITPPAADTAAAAASNANMLPEEPKSEQLAADGSPATTIAQTPSYGQPDIIVTVHPAAQEPAKGTGSPKSAKGPRTAKTKTMMAATTPSLERQVALASRPQLMYPSQALRVGEQGTVLVLAQVDVNGQVSDARVVRRSGSSILDHAASNEVRRWKFAPALHDGRPIAANVEVPVSYRLDQ